MQAALEVISTRGFYGASMSMIAQQVQVAMETIYRFFPSKECLIRDHVLGFIRLDEPLVEETVAACWDAIRS